MKVFNALTKPFEAPQRSVKVKVLSKFFLFVWDRDPLQTEVLTLSFIMLKNGQTYFKNL